MAFSDGNALVWSHPMKDVNLDHPRILIFLLAKKKEKRKKKKEKNNLQEILSIFFYAFNGCILHVTYFVWGLTNMWNVCYIMYVTVWQYSTLRFVSTDIKRLSKQQNTVKHLMLVNLI